MLVLLAFVTFGVVLAVALRARRASVRVRHAMGSRPIGPDGIMAGAGPITLSRGADAPGMLLLHGGGDTPQTLRYLAEHLYQRGYAVHAPLLPGHGRSIEDFARVTSGEWRDAARTAYREMRERHNWVGVAGLSMGGALAVQVAAETSDLPALALLAPYLSMPREVAIAARLARFWGIAVPYVRSLDPGARRSINDPEEDARNLAYGVFTPAALRALRATVARAASLLPRVAAPTLMIQSREDNRIAPADAQRAFDRLGTTDKELMWIEGAGHVITVDYGRDRVFEVLGRWLDSHRASQGRRVQA